MDVTMEKRATGKAIDKQDDHLLMKFVRAIGIPSIEKRFTKRPSLNLRNMEERSQDGKPIPYAVAFPGGRVDLTSSE